MAEFAIMRFEKLSTQGRGSGSLYRSLRHLDKHKESADISRPELSALNSRLVTNTKTYKECLALAEKYKQRHNTAVDEYNQAHGTKKRHLREDASQFFEGVFTFTPEAEKHVDYKKWVSDNVSFLKNEFEGKGCRILRCDVHADETTFHIHFVALAWDKRTQRSCVRDFLGGSAELSALQDRYAIAMKPHGLERGASRYHEALEAKQNKTPLPERRRHQKIGKWKAEIAKLQMQIETLSKNKKGLEDWFSGHQSDETRDIENAFKDARTLGKLLDAAYDYDPTFYDKLIKIYEQYINRRETAQNRSEDDFER